MPVPIHSKKFAAAKAKAMQISSQKITVGQSREELEKKYGNKKQEEKPVEEEKEESTETEEVNEEDIGEDTVIGDDENNEEENLTDGDMNPEEVNEEEEAPAEDENNEEEVAEEEPKEEPVEPKKPVKKVVKSARQEEPAVDGIPQTSDDFFAQIAQEREQLKNTSQEVPPPKEDPKKEVQERKDAPTENNQNEDDFNIESGFIQIKRNPLSEIKDSFNFDLDAIEIERSDNDLTIATNAEAALDEEAVFQVALLKSGYVAHVAAITFKDRDAIRGSLAGRVDNKDLPNIRRKMYRIVYDKIKWTSVGRMTFDEFLRVTAFDDLETLYYGIFCKSNPKNSTFSIKCPKCGYVNKIEVNSQTLLSVRDLPDLRKQINDLLKDKALTPMELVKRSMVNMKQRVLLPESKIVAEIRVPSLQDYLNFNINYSNTQIDTDLSETIGFLIYLDRLLIPDFDAIRRTGKPKYFEIKNFFKMLSYIGRIGLKDGETLVDAINTREDKYKIGYKIMSMPCGQCAEKLGEASVSMDDFLFQS